MEYTFYKTYSDLTNFVYHILDEGGKRQFNEVRFLELWNERNQPTIIIESSNNIYDVIDGELVINLEQVKLTQIELLKSEYQSAREQGVTINEITLAIMDDDINQFHRQLTFVQSILATGQAIPSVSIVDLGGVIHDLNTNVYIPTILQYGITYNQMFFAYANKLVLIKNATTYDEIKAIHY